MIKKITCIIVDDDEIDRLTVLAFLENYSFIEVKGSYDVAAMALPAVQSGQPDVLFLDIDMPGMNGLQLRAQLLQIPVCIFITAYPDYAVDGFALEAMDFLIKPFSAERFNKTMNRLQDYMMLRTRSDLLSHTLGADTVFIKEGHNNIKLLLHEIIYLEALNNYTSIITNNRKYTVLSPISSLLKEKSFGNFIRIHRSYAVQKHFIRKISAGEVLVENTALPIGRSYKEALTFLK
jgi:two-component system, LytTR family, response regulator